MLPSFSHNFRTNSFEPKISLLFKYCWSHCKHIINWFDSVGEPQFSKFNVSSDNTMLTVSDVCKQCSDGSSDLAVIQCNVTNKYGFIYGEAYLNVLRMYIQLIILTPVKELL